MLKISADDGRRERTRGIHGRSGNRAGEHCFQANDGTYRDSSCDSFFLRANRDAQDDEHQHESEDHFENKALHRRASRESCPECWICREQELEKAAGSESTANLSDDVRRHFGPAQASRGSKRGRDGGVQVRAADISESVDHGQDNEAERKRYPRVGNRAMARLVDHDRARSGKDQGKSPEEFSDVFLHNENPFMPSVFFEVEHTLGSRRRPRVGRCGERGAEHRRQAARRF